MRSVFHSLNQKLLFWLIIFAFVPLVISSFYGYKNSKKALEKQIFSNLDVEVRFKSFRIHHFLSEQKDDLSLIAAKSGYLNGAMNTIVSLQSSSSRRAEVLGEATNHLKQKVHENPNVAEYLFVGSDGRVIISSDETSFGANLSEEKFIRVALGGKPVNDLYKIGRKGSPWMIQSIPFYDSKGKMQGIFVKKMNLRFLGEVLSDRRLLGNRTDALLINSEGIIISGARPLDADREISAMQLSSAKGCYGSTKDSRIYSSNGKRGTIGACHYIPETEWYLLAEISSDEAFAPLTSLKERAIAFGSALFVTLLVAASLIARTIAKPIKALSEASRAIGEGNYGLKIKLESRDEIGTLAREFQKMAQRINKSQSELENEVESRTRSLKRSEMGKWALFRISELVAQNRYVQIENILEKLIDIVLDMANLKVSCIYLFDEDHTKIEFKAAGLRLDQANSRIAPPDCADFESKLLTVNGFVEDSQFSRELKDFIPGEWLSKLDGIGRDEFMSCPLVAHDDFIGVMQFAPVKSGLVQWEDVSALRSIARQISLGIKRTKLEQDLRSREHYIASIVDYSADAIISLDTEGRIMSWNDGAKHLFGYGEQEIIGMPFSMLAPDELKRSGELRKITEELAHKGVIRNYETEGLTKSKDKLIVDMTLTELRDDTGSIIGTSVILRDKTEQKKLERRILQAEKLSAVGELTAGLAHEIGTPLNIISGRAEYLLSEVENNSNLAASLKIIISQIDRITHLIKQLLKFSRSEKENVRPLNINEVILDTLLLMETKFAKSGVEVVKRLQSGLPLILGDANSLQQVFINILINAIHAMPRGGRVEILTESEADKKYIAAKIKDTGCGIAPEHLQRIYHPFFTTKETGKGTGLGLAVTFGIIKDHNGEIDCESAVGDGTTFIIRLPILEKAMALEDEEKIYV